MSLERTEKPAVPPPPLVSVADSPNVAALQAASLAAVPRSGASPLLGSWFKDSKRVPSTSRLPAPRDEVDEVKKAAAARIDEAKQERSRARTDRASQEGAQDGATKDSSLKEGIQEGNGKGPKKEQGPKGGSAPSAASPSSTRSAGSIVPGGHAGVAQAPSGSPMKVPRMGSLRGTEPLDKGGPKMADGSSLVVPSLHFSPRAETQAKVQAQVSGLSLLMQTPDECPMPTVFLFFSEDPEERAALTIQHYTRAWLERRMVRYLQTMRRLILLLATRERKAARLIRERWLTKVILERNSQRLRPLLEALLGSVCIDKPDRLLDYATEWMRTNFPEEASQAASAECRCMWSPRDDIEPTQEALMEYLESSNATTVLEGIIERAISAQPENLHAYVVDELVAQNPDVQLPSEDEDEDGLHAPVLCALAEEEEELLQEELEEDEEKLLDEETVLLEIEELDAEEEVLELEEEEALLEQQLEEEEPRAESELSLAQSPLGALGTLAEEEEGEEEDDLGS